MLRSFPLAPQSSLADVGAFAAHWVEFSLQQMHWLNVLLSGRKHGMFWTATTTGAVVDSQEPVRIPATALSEPKYGAQVKVLHWAAATSALRLLHVTEKGKEVPLAQVLLREGLKMETLSVRWIETLTIVHYYNFHHCRAQQTVH